MTTTKTFQNVEIKDETAGQVSALFSVFGNVDSDGDVLVKGAFTDGAKVVISAYGHTSWDGFLPVGKGTIHETDEGAVLDGQFFLDTTHGADAFHTVKSLAEDGLQEWSYSLEQVEAERGEVDGKSVRLIKKVNVKEVSPVLRGANPLTRTLAVKAGAKFSDHREVVLTAVDDLLKRAMEVVTLRAAEGKSCPSAAELFDELDRRVKDFAEQVAKAAPTPQFNDAAAREFLRSVAIAQGVTL